MVTEAEQTTTPKLDYANLYLDLSMTYIRVSPDDPEAFTNAIGVTILADREDIDEGGEENRVRIGHMTASLIRVSDARQAGWDMITALDAPSSATADCLRLIGDGDEYTEAVQKVLSGDVTWPDSILLIEKVEIDTEHRGHNAGLHAMRAFIDIWGLACSMVVCKPFPLQYSTEVNNSNRSEFRAAQTKLRKYWSQAGFRRVPGTELYVLSPLHRLPELPSLS